MSIALPSGASLVAQMIKNPPACRRTGFNPWVGKIPWRREWQPTPLFLPEQFHGQRSLADLLYTRHTLSPDNQVASSSLLW